MMFIYYIHVKGNKRLWAKSSSSTYFPDELASRQLVDARHHHFRNCLVAFVVVVFAMMFLFSSLSDVVAAVFVVE